MDFDDLDEAEDDAIGPEGPVRKLPRFQQISTDQFDFLEMKDRAGLNLPGDYYGIEFPHTKEQLMQWGGDWLTKAFHKSGVMGLDNAVTFESIKDVTGSVSGGAGLKYLMKVSYSDPKPYLHTDLFVKLPHEPKGSDRYYVSVMWGHDRPESIFNIWLAPYVPCKVPKMYFADINKSSTNFILITEQVKFADRGTKEFVPGDIEPSYLKYADYEMVDGGPMYYLAACKSLGKIAAYHKTGRLHPEVNDMFPMPPEAWEVPKGLPGVDADSKKQEMAKCDQFIKFMTEMAEKIYPKEITNKAWLEELKVQIGNIMDYGTEIHCFCSGAGTPSPNDYVCLTHNNLQVDNAIYYHNESNELEVGMLDWGVLCCGPFIGSIQGGCISGSQVHVYLEYRDRFIQAAADSYTENGGPALDVERLKVMCDLQLANWVIGCPKNTGAILKDVKQKEWADITELTDKRIMKNWNAWAWCSQYNNALLIYQKMDVYAKFQRWLQDAGLPAKKS